MLFFRKKVHIAFLPIIRYTKTYEGTGINR